MSHSDYYSRPWTVLVTVCSCGCLVFRLFFVVRLLFAFHIGHFHIKACMLCWNHAEVLICAVRAWAPTGLGFSSDFDKEGKNKTVRGTTSG